MSQTMLDSIAAARADQQRERAIASQVLGVPVTDAGIEVPPLFAAYTIVCPVCLKPCGGANEGQAHKAWAAHHLSRHV